MQIYKYRWALVVIAFAVILVLQVHYNQQSIDRDTENLRLMNNWMEQDNKITELLMK